VTLAIAEPSGFLDLAIDLALSSCSRCGHLIGGGTQTSSEGWATGSGLQSWWPAAVFVVQRSPWKGAVSAGQAIAFEALHLRGGHRKWPPEWFRLQ